MVFRFKYIMRSIIDIEGSILIALIAFLTIFFGMVTSSFLTIRNFMIMLESLSVLGILTVGMTIVLIAGEIDVSVTEIMELAATVAALMSMRGYSTPMNIAITFLTVLAIGFVNGFFSAIIKIPSFLVTLATSAALLGAVLVLTKYSSIPILDTSLTYIFYGAKIFGITVAFFWLLAVLIIFAFILNYTSFGRWKYMTGGNPTNAWLLGIPTVRVKFTVFIISAILAGLAGLIYGSRAVSARAYMASAYLMPSIAAAVMGGASLTGGKGSLVKAILAAFLLTEITNGVYIMGLEPAMYNVFMGVVLIAALSLRLLPEKGVFSLSLSTIAKKYKKHH